MPNDTSATIDPMLTAYTNTKETTEKLDTELAKETNKTKTSGSKRKRNNKEAANDDEENKNDEDSEQGAPINLEDFLKILGGTAAAANTSGTTKKPESKNPFNIPDIDGNTPLHIACKNGFSQQAAQMIILGANPIATNKEGDTPIHIAQKNGQYEVVEVIMQILLKLSKAQMDEDEDSPKKKSKKSDEPPPMMYMRKPM